jgi:alkylation response protein AidB-like acyl-CoA dehydrogenase
MSMNSEIKELHESARQVIDGLGLAADEQSTWSTIAELGWLMVSAPEELGGLGMGLEGLCALQLEQGRGLVTVPYLPALLSIEAIVHGELADKASWLERLTTGESYVAAPLADSAITVARNDDTLTLTGLLTTLSSVDRASHVLVATDAVVALLPVASAQVTARRTWDTTRRFSDLRFDGVAVDKSLVVAVDAAAAALTRRLATMRDFALAADAVGGAAAILKMTVDYLQTRQQFGRPLAMFQALKHRCADLKAQVEAADALLHDNLARAGDDLAGAEAETLARAAKQLACAVYAAAAEEGIQLHGGIGVTEEYPCHLFLKRALLNEQLGRGDCYEQALADELLQRFA